MIRNFLYILALLFLSALLFSCNSNAPTEINADISTDDKDYAGSVSCRQCHERFYKLWAPSHHGLAMQPVSKELLDKHIPPMSNSLQLEGKDYKTVIEDTLLIVKETSNGTTTNYQAIWALGGKNVYYFLTEIEGGKLQTLPLAYDVRRKEWYNNPESALRHFPDGSPDSALSWKDRMYTFNTSCYSCHISQLSNNFDLASNTYKTTWKESGINCETCHGPSAEHVKVCLEAGEGNVPEDLKIIVTSTFTHEQNNWSCAPCHAKMAPLTPSYMPGDPFFDNYNLTTLEHPDHYPDGRDLGENYTYTTWLLSPCVQSGELDCIHCHTSSGRYRFKGENANNACMPCHTEQVSDITKHSHHPATGGAEECISCHMPKTEFGRMIRSDHSMRPPMPASSIKFKSPNACNICHNDKDNSWSNKFVNKWHTKDYQKPWLYQSELLEEARNHNWERLDEMLTIVKDEEMDEVYTTSFVRLFEHCEDDKIWNVLIKMLSHSSPLVRSASANLLIRNVTEESKIKLLKAAQDTFRIVRLAAAQSLARFPDEMFLPDGLKIKNNVLKEYETSLVCRPDDWASHYNLGNFYHNRNKPYKAIHAYETSIRLFPEAILPLINSSLVYAQTGDQHKAEDNLRQALKADPESEAAHLNLGLLLAEQKKYDEAGQLLEKTLEINANSAVAAYNISVINGENNLKKAVRYSKIASDIMPENPRYAYTYSFYSYRNGENENAITALEMLLDKMPDYFDAIFLLGELYRDTKQTNKAIELYTKYIHYDNTPEQLKQQFNQLLQRLRTEK